MQPVEIKTKLSNDGFPSHAPFAQKFNFSTAQVSDQEIETVQTSSFLPSS